MFCEIVVFLDSIAVKLKKEELEAHTTRLVNESAAWMKQLRVVLCQVCADVATK